jgi:hypothetical protein
MGLEAGVDDPMPALRRRVRSVGLAGLVLGIVYALTVISDPPVTGFDAAHPWLALPAALAALTAARRTADAPFGTPGGQLLRGALWLPLAVSAGWNVAAHGGGDTLLVVVGIATVLVALANVGIRAMLSRASATRA